MEEKIAYALPDRFVSGSYGDKSIIEGDISKSYSADKIAMENTFRKPFQWTDGLRISTGGSFIKSSWKTGGVKTYRLIPIEAYEGKTHTYSEASRWNYRDEEKDEWVHGFTYEGMRLKKGKQEFVMCDELNILPREEKTAEQLSLF